MPRAPQATSGARKDPGFVGPKSHKFLGDLPLNSLRKVKPLLVASQGVASRLGTSWMFGNFFLMFQATFYSLNKRSFGESFFIFLEVFLSKS